jgi:hypothetical protein
VTPMEALASRLSGPVHAVEDLDSYDTTPAEPAEPRPTDIQLYISGDVSAPTLSQAPPTTTAQGRSMRGCGWIDVVFNGVERQAFVSLLPPSVVSHSGRRSF